MNICMVVPVGGRGRREDVLNVCMHLSERGHDVCVIANRPYNEPAYEELHGISIYRIGALWAPKIRYPLSFTPGLLKRLRSIIEERGVELVHFWNLEYMTSLPLLLLRDKPKVLSIEGLPGINWFYGDLVVDSVGRAYTLLIGKRILSSASRVVVYGRSLIPRLMEFGVPREKIRVAAYGVSHKVYEVSTRKQDVREEKRKELGLSGDDLVITFIGRLSPVKGISFLLKVADVMSKRYPEAKFLVVGDGELRHAVEEACRRSPNMVFLGYRRDCPEMMCASDILFLPSLSEGLPLVILEAGVVGLPVVATGVGCIPDVIINGKTGLLVRHSISDMVSALSALIEDGELRERLSENLSRHVRKNYDWGHVIDRYEELYEEVMSEHEV